MRHTTSIALLAVLTLGLGASLAAEGETQYPLGSGKLTLVGSAKASSRRILFTAKWNGAATAMPNPVDQGATLRVTGGTGEGDSGLIQLPRGNWRELPKKKGYRYSDKKGRSAGIKLVELRLTGSGGRVRIGGGSGRWTYQVGGKPQTLVTVTLISGTSRWCAEFSSPKTKKDRVTATAATAPAACPCQKYDSTFEAIQATIFERQGCTNLGCHANASTGGTLELTHDKAYDNLVNVVSPTGVTRVVPFQPQESFLWQKLAASTEGFDLGGKGSPMPQGLPPISTDELNAIRQWILKGAPRDGVVPDTETLLNACLPKPEPQPDQPLAAPVEGQGIQMYAPPWEIPAKQDSEGANGENEVCYSTYYNLAGKTPPQYIIPCPPGIFDGATNPTKQCFTYDHQLLRQSPNSHHSIIHIYNGDYAANYADPVNHRDWGNQCSGGTVPDGTPCDPTVPGVPAPAGADCGGGYCRGKVVKSVACTFGYGPPDFDGGVLGNGTAVAPSFSGSQQPQFERQNPAGVFSLLPIEGTIVWNSHAFNVYDTPTFNQQWLNLWFTNDLQYPLQGIFDSADIFVQNVLPFQEVEYCRTVLFSKGTRIADFSSHTHKRGRLFRVWGPGIAQPCNSTMSNPGACLPESTPPIMVTTEYNDPAQLIFKTPLALDGDDASRRFKFCSIYDNGHTDPATVKRNSTSPVVLLGGKCYASPPRPGQTIYCANRKNADGSPISCAGDDRVCDSASGANDGQCDACALRGGVSTEDEMFILIGSNYCDPSALAQPTCATRPGGRVACDSGPNRGGDCTTDADCPKGCDPYSNR